MKVGVAGAGRLGSAIAERLLKSGLSVGVWNRAAEKAIPLVELGATAYETPRELAEASDCVLTVLTNLEALRSVYGGSSGLLAATGSRTLVEMSTLPPQAHVELSELVRSRGFAYLECPVVGSRDAALSGQLIGLAAGQATDLTFVRGVLDAVCRRVEYVGDIGSAASVKLAMNLPLIVYFQVMSESLRLVDHLKLDPHLIVSLLAESSGGPNFLRAKGETIAQGLAGGDLPPAQATVAVFNKDLQIMLDEAKALGLRLPAVSTALTEYRKIEAEHPGDIDGMLLPALLLQAARKP